MEWKDGRVVGFKCRFKSVEDDDDRYLDAMVELNDKGGIPREPGVSLINMTDAGRAWIEDQYFEARRFDQIETDLIGNVSFSYAPIYEGNLATMERLHGEGETQRVRRVWRHAIAHRKAGFWEHVRARNKGPDPETHWSGDAAEAAAGHERLKEWINHNKPYLLQTISGYIDFLEKIDPDGIELSKVRQSLTEVESEERQKLSGKTDTRKMDDDVFWELIEDGMPEATAGERLETLPDRLALFKPPAIRKFAEILRDKDDAAYRSDIWALPYLFAGGCSDDGFDDFRSWLILQGREAYETVINDPDQYDLEKLGTSFSETTLRGVAEMAFDMREAKAMRPLKKRTRKLGGPNVEEEAFASLLPNIAASLGRV